MGSYLFKRAVQIIIVVIAALTINFALVHLAPGDPASMMLGIKATEAEREELREEMGFNRSIPVQYFEYVKMVLRGELGNSYRFKVPVADLILDRIPSTLILAGSAFITSLFFGVLLGAIAALRVNTWVDRLINAISILGFSVPVFWLGILLILFFSLKLGLFPTQGMYDVRENFTGIQRWLDLGKHLVLPVTALTAQSVGSYAILMRSSMLEVLNEDYIRTARAKGLWERLVISRHALGNASLSVLTLMGLRVGGLFSSSVIVEIVFAWPGNGRLMFDAMSSRDYPVLLASFLMVTIMVAFGNLLADMIYAVADPRIRYD